MRYGIEAGNSMDVDEPPLVMPRKEGQSKTGTRSEYTLPHTPEWIFPTPDCAPYGVKHSSNNQD